MSRSVIVSGRFEDERDALVRHLLRSNEPHQPTTAAVGK